MRASALSTPNGGTSPRLWRRWEVVHYDNRGLTVHPNVWRRLELVPALVLVGRFSSRRVETIF